MVKNCDFLGLLFIFFFTTNKATTLKLSKIFNLISSTNPFLILLYAHYIEDLLGLKNIYF
uniref:Uncharacterized protein n=1 Tax=Meloidogyne enterolobii TaxID=390850 RepID=A0A6V7UH49_MELEN|nr:unnamed protein product [Meloidogyne enterolobii]